MPYTLLSDRKIKALKPKEKPYSVSDGQGLFLEIRPSGLKRWIQKIYIAGKAIRITLDAYPETGLGRVDKFMEVLQQEHLLHNLCPH